MAKRVIGLIGLGKMGGNLALQAAEKKYAVIGHSRTFKEHLQAERIHQVSDLQALISELPKPRIILMFLPAGKVIDKILEDLIPRLSQGDALIDCGNSYWRDSIVREERIRKTGVHFIDCGTSGGLEGARHGACFMTGGSDEAIRVVENVLKDLATKGGYIHTGRPGMGHFVKLVHNGIEFGMLQAIAEGVNLLDKCSEKLDLAAILQCWEHGSVIRSWLIELMRIQLQNHQTIEYIPSHVEDTGEVNWLINDAMKMDAPIPIITQSVMQLIATRDHTRTWAKAIGLVRQSFGGHPLGEDDNIRHERASGKLDCFAEIDTDSLDVGRK
ncbi:MAG: phosphogluconate dehydrogenase (NAD(+)-dependent, decarboxylating) [Bacteroidota bacterium]